MTLWKRARKCRNITASNSRRVNRSRRDGTQAKRRRLAKRSGSRTGSGGRFLRKPLHELKLDRSTYTALRSAGVHRTADLAYRVERGKKIPGVGQTRLGKIRAALGQILRRV